MMRLTPLSNRQPIPPPAALPAPRFGQAGPIQPDGFYQRPNPTEEALANKPPFRFLVMGDQGSGARFTQLMGRWLEPLFKLFPFYNVVVLGDNVYGAADDGVHPMDGSPSLFEDRIWTPLKGLIQKGVHFFPTHGNHDVRGKEEAAQMAYWNVPRYYKFSRGNVDFFSVDTTVMLPRYDSCYKDRVAFAQQQTRDQLTWLDTELGNSKAKYRVVYGHYPMYCSGRYVNRGINAELIRNFLQPILVRHQVDAYLCGHEHHYERSEPIYGVTHFLSGGASKLTKKITHLADAPYPRAKVLREHNMMLFEETPQGLNYKTLNDSGTLIDEGLLPPKQRTQPPAAQPNPPGMIPGIPNALKFLTSATEVLHKPPSPLPSAS